jgi:NAD(P)-dependent dehydrogenase (short-subunit alcohol dehydrogenase family)
VAGTFIVNAHVADAINYPLNHPNGPDEHAPFWTTDEERGVIINFASAAAAPYARVLGYGPGKLAVVGITKAMADFLGPSGIRVVSISPCKSGRGEGKRRIRGPDRWGNEPNRATR